MHDVAVTPGLLNANGVLTAYAHLASDCNLARLYAVDDRAQLVGGSQDERYWLDAYMKVVNQLCCDSIRQGVLGEMLFAIFRGISSVFKLHAHTDEGGYARRAAYTADYPRPRGWINAERDPNAMHIFCKLKKPHARCVLADCLELLLLCAGLFQDSDPLATGVEGEKSFVTLVTPTNLERTKQQGTPDYYSQMLGILERWREHVVNTIGVWQGCPSYSRKYASSGFLAYCRSERPDRHLMCTSTDGILAYSWVEPCALNLSNRGCRLPGPGGINCPRNIRYFNTKAKTSPIEHALVEDSRGCTSGAWELYRIRHWQARAQGATYLCSPRVSSKNGYDSVQLRLNTGGAPALTREVSLAHQGDEEVSLADMLWERPHCPIPFQGEVSVVGSRAAGLVCRIRKCANFFSAAHHGTDVKVTVGALHQCENCRRFRCPRK